MELGEPSHKQCVYNLACMIANVFIKEKSLFTLLKPHTPQTALMLQISFYRL